MRKALAVLITGMVLAGSANAACKVGWMLYGDPQLMPLIQPHVANHATDEYCAKFAERYELVLITNAYVQRDDVVGHAAVGIRKKGSRAVPVQRKSDLLTDRGVVTQAAANRAAVDATFAAVDELMRELHAYKVIE